MECFRVCSKNDNNGNPRRVFVLIQNGNIVDTIDEGYEGNRVLREKYPNVIVSCDIDTTVKDYRLLVKLGENRRKYMLTHTERIEHIAKQNQ